MREQKGNAAALLPIGIFLVIFLGSGIVTGDFYAMPAIVAFLIALLAAFLQHRASADWRFPRDLPRSRDCF